MKQVEYFISVPEAERIFGKETNLSAYEFCGYYRLIRAACGDTSQYPEKSLSIKEIDEFLEMLGERRMQCIRLRFWECLSLRVIGKHMAVSGEMVRQILRRIMLGVAKRFSPEVVKSTIQAKQKIDLDAKEIEYESSLPIQKLKLPERCLNALLRAGLDTIGKVLVKSDDELLRVRNFGKMYMIQLDEELQQSLGITRCHNNSHKLEKMKTELQELISKNNQSQFLASVDILNLSVRTSNALKRAKIHTVGELLSKSDEELLKVKNLGLLCLNEIDEKLKQCFEAERSKVGYEDIKQKFVKFLAAGKQYEFNEPIEILNLSTKIYKTLKRNSIDTIGQLLAKDKEQLLKFRQIGVVSVQEIRTKIHQVLHYECFN